jgi:hypothetical protein
MKLRINRTMSGVLAAAIMASGTLAAIAPAQAYTGTPPWVAGDVNNLGGIKVYDVAGQLITGGSDYNVLGTFYAGQTTAKYPGATRASMDIAFPDATNAVPSTWFSVNLQSSVLFTADPAAPSATGPVIKKTSWGAGLTPVADTLSGGTSSSAANYENTFELRMLNTGPGVSAGGKYWSVVIEYNPAAVGGSTFDGLAPKAWRQVWPTVTTTQATVSAPAASASAPYAAGQQITLTSQSSAAGTIQFTQDGSSIGLPKTVDGSFSATSDSITLTAGDHTFTASFTPSDTATYTGATSSPLTFTVNGAPTTVTQPTASLSSPIAFGTQISLTATATAGVPGTILFKDNGSLIAGLPAVAVNNAGSATSASFQPAAGNHSYTAVFTPTDYINYSQSTSAALTYVVNAVAPLTQAPGTTTTGSHYVGGRLNCVKGPWLSVDANTSYAYTWWANGVKFATGPTYVVLAAAQAGRSVICRVTAANGTVTAYDDSPAVTILKGNFVNKAKPAIGGVLKVGKLLTASTGTWTPAGTSYTYQWKRGSTIIGRAKTYRATAKDKGKILTVTVTAVRAGYNNKAVASLGKKIS